jgi:superfamily II DNA/RNA helicase
MGLFNGKSGVVQMPTGAGKTKAISMAIYSAFCTKNVSLSIIIAPFRALCREISNDLKNDLQFDDNIQISEISDLLQIDYILEDLFNPERKTVVVTTPEKFSYIIRHDESIIDSVGQLIFDEGHLFDDEERGVTYELLISSILKQVDQNAQKILISAIIPNVTEINNWFTKGEGVAFSGDDISIVDKLPAALKWENIGGNNYGYLYFVSKDDYSSADFFVPRMIEIKPLQRRPRESQRYFPSVDFAHGKMSEANDMAIACLLKIVPNDNAAIFCGRKDSANKMLSRIIELEQRGYDISGLKLRSDPSEITRLSNLIEKHYGKDNVLYKAAQFGVFVHHAGVSDGIKNAVEYALKESKITNVICTSTLAQGVNLPIKYLIISSIYQAGEQIKVRDFHNLIGRTARSGMFTEGTIIFSDPFAYNVNRWKWDQYKRLLDPNNSESCTSIILDIVRPHMIRNKSVCRFFNTALMRYTDFEKFQEIKKKFLSIPNQDPEIIRLFKHVFNILSRIENYISLAIANNNNIYTDDFVDELLSDTLAKAVATETEKAELKMLFEKICEYISNILQDENSKRIFARSMISCEAYLELQKEVASTNIFEFSDNELLDFVVRMIIKYSSPRQLHKIVKVEDAVEIANMWMKGDEYYIIKCIADLCDYKIARKNRAAIVSVEEIASICDGDFGYTASIIINSICEILNSNNIINDENEENNYLEVAEKLQKLSQRLKYGLPELTDIYVYELGFNDRFLAQEIHKIIGNHMKKAEVKKAIKRNRARINEFLDDYPSVFQNRLSNL